MPRFSLSPSDAGGFGRPGQVSISGRPMDERSRAGPDNSLVDSFLGLRGAAYTYDLLGRFPHPISLYQHLPELSAIPVSAFEEVAVQRLRVLNFLHEKFGAETSLSPAILRDSGSRKAASAPATAGSVRAPTAEVQLKELLEEAGFMLGRPVGGAPAPSPDLRQAVAMRDAISHFALRLAFSTDKERQQWFVRQEARLFLYRLDELMKYRGDSTSTGFERDQPFNEFLRREGLDYDFVTRPQRSDSPAMNLWQRATEFRGGDTTGAYSYQELRLFLVPFYPDAASLVARRRVYVHRFIAYVPFTDMDQVLLSKFKTVLSECFTLLESRQTTLQTNVFGDPRIGELLMAIPTVYIGKDFRKDTVETAEDRLTPQNAKDVWRTSFPPCMRRLFGAYMRDHHMRHSGRLQLWLFFKGAGMKLDENLQFNRALWQDAQKFDREHSYTLRHIYGQEGKRADYPPLSCSKIISGGGMLQTPGVGDFHGCPFKHFDRPQLQKLLSEFGLSFNQLLPVLKYKDTNEYQLACREFFMQTHPGSEGEGVGNHPNHFYEASRRYARRQGGAPSSASASPAETKGEKVEEDVTMA
ncbi:putative DNA primase, large subunit [Neospora caninum Liverpool]|uniref:DNA primase, large subunit, putative n=1 Tax=Neospora caninum (strain Liverpool) TaxID=572307 RepID=F0V909_NEOCL|nr:putative DNA primase, large subunit [Neospora caninum Liverpool]CBZ50200.1 putative DNA primase, large subunit [Neospora caninum Liverpool]CEL64800.1 TPA: DNA primase, large subunit, putative [Neospora caninum Liverpool]|eukprot:XP_003880235.1 putative DNA primase, large subunit [Neospora caninum Liverpool]